MLEIFLLGLIVALFWLNSQYVVPILMYHNVNENRGNDLNTVTPQTFERQMAFLKRWGYRVLSIDEYMRIKEARGRFPKNSIVITFDDGCEDNYSNALPILKKYGFSAIEFVAVDFLGQANFMSLKQVKEMQNAGITIGSHTRKHFYLPSLNKEELEKELAGSKETLEKHLQKKVEYICYPSGGFNRQVKAMAQACGYKAGFTTNRGYEQSNQDMFELRRIRMNDTDHDLIIWAKCSGFYNLTRRLIRPCEKELE